MFVDAHIGLYLHPRLCMSGQSRLESKHVYTPFSALDRGYDVTICIKFLLLMAEDTTFSQE